MERSLDVLPPGDDDDDDDGDDDVLDSFVWGFSMFFVFCLGGGVLFYEAQLTSFHGRQCRDCLGVHQPGLSVSVSSFVSMGIPNIKLHVSSAPETPTCSRM